jgi:hypothetical protein
VGVPKVFSENRRWATCALLSPDVIAGDKVYTADDPDGLAFAVISSSAFIDWQKTIGGRLKSDPSFSNTLVWNNFPMPSLAPDQRAAIIAGGQAVINSRALHPERSLAQHYNSLAMDPELIRAHTRLDRVLDAVFGLTGQVGGSDRLTALFASYERMIREGQIAFSGSTRRGRK